MMPGITVMHAEIILAPKFSTKFSKQLDIKHQEHIDIEHLSI